MTKILVYVQHLLGIGHLHRTALITSALGDNGFDVTVVSGGIPEAQVDFGRCRLVQLAAIKTDAQFSNLYDENGEIVTDEFKQQRCEKLISLYREIKPDVLLIETYPFGRRQMRFELLPLLKQVENEHSRKPLVACSIRDVIQPKSKPKRIAEIVDIIQRYFDLVLVHGDASFIPFERSFPQAVEFKEKLFYTGYVAKSLSVVKKSSIDNIILVSAGGGSVGQKLYQTAINAANSSSGRSYQWHVLVGNNISDQAFNKLQEQRSNNLVIERNRSGSDFIELLANSTISISQAGYNTIMDILVTQVSAIVIPFEGVAEQEQINRANALKEKGVLTILRENELSESALLKVISGLQQNTDKSNISIKMDGAAQTTSLMKHISLNKTMT